MKNGFKVLISAAAGLAYGLFFAQKSGKKLRSEIKNSETPGKTFIEEFKKMINESGSEISTVVKNSKEIQDLLKSGKVQFEEFIKTVRDLGDEASENAKDEIETLAKNAKKSAGELKGKVQKVGKEGKKVKKNFENKLEKEVKNIVKKFNKK
jgi:gas vesicle protein